MCLYLFVLWIKITCTSQEGVFNSLLKSLHKYRGSFTIDFNNEAGKPCLLKRVKRQME